MGVFFVGCHHFVFQHRRSIVGLWKASLAYGGHVGTIGLVGVPRIGLVATRVARWSCHPRSSFPTTKHGRDTTIP